MYTPSAGAHSGRVQEKGAVSSPLVPSGHEGVGTRPCGWAWCREVTALGAFGRYGGAVKVLPVEPPFSG